MRIHTCALAAIVALGCSHKSSPVGVPGQIATVADSSFNAAVTGAVTDSLKGPALFQEIQTETGSDSALALAFGVGTQTGALIFLRDTSSPPYFGTDSLYSDTTTQTPSIGYRAFGVLGPSCSGCTPTARIYIVRGSISVTGVSPFRVRGSFSLHGYEVPNDSLGATDSINVTGGFIAAAGPAVIDTTTGSNAGPCGVVQCEQVLPYPIGLNAPPDPARVLDLIEAFRRSKTLFAAVQLGIFNGERPQGLAVDRLLDACVALGLLERHGAAYRNTPVANAYLCRSNPHTLSGYIRYSDAALYPLWAHLDAAIVQGSNRWQQTFGGERRELFAHFFATEQLKRDFFAGMHGMGMLSSPAIAAAFDLTPFRRFVDLGGGTGHLALAVRDRYPTIHATVVDLPEVIPVAREYVGDRVTLAAGDFLVDPLPAGDLYGLSRILHDWGEDTIRAILARVHAALPAGGGLLIGEMLLDEDRRGPIRAHMQSLNMLVATEGRERTLSDYTALLTEAGFRTVRGAVTGTVLDAILAIT